MTDVGVLLTDVHTRYFHVQETERTNSPSADCSFQSHKAELTRAVLNSEVFDLNLRAYMKNLDLLVPKVKTKHGEA